MKTWKEVSYDFIELHTKEDMKNAGEQLKEIFEGIVPFEPYYEITERYSLHEQRLIKYGFEKCRQEMLEKVNKFFE